MSPCAVENTENSSPYQGTNNKKSKASSPAPASVQRRRRRRATIECSTSPKLDDASSSGGLWKERIDEILNRDSSSTSRQGHEHQNQRSPSISYANANTSALNNLDSLCPFKALQSQKMAAATTSTASTAYQVHQPKKTINRRPKFVAPTMLSDESNTSSSVGASCSSSETSSAQKKKTSRGFKAQQRRRHSMSECPTNNNEMFTQSMPQLPLDDDNTTNDTNKMSDNAQPPSNKKCISKFKYQRRNSDHGPRTHNTLFSGGSSPTSSTYVEKKQQHPSFVTGSCSFNSKISTSSSSGGKSSQFAKSKSKKEQVLPSSNKNLAASNNSKASEAHIFAQWDAALERYQREQQETSNGNNKSVARGVQDGLKEPPKANQAMTKKMHNKSQLQPRRSSHNSSSRSNRDYHDQEAKEEKSLSSSSIVSGSRRRRRTIITSNNDDDDEDYKPRLHRTCSAGSFASLASAVSSRRPSSSSATTTSPAAVAANKKSTLSKKKVTTTISSTVTATTCSSASDSHASTTAANSSVAAASITSNLEMLGHASNNSSRVQQQPHKCNFVIQVPSQSSVEGLDLDDSLSSLEVSLRSYTTSNNNVLDVSSSSITKQARINEINE